MTETIKTTTDEFLLAAAIYRDSPNTFGHGENDGDRKKLKVVLGLVASQAMLHESIVYGRFDEYEDASLGMKHLWTRLQVIEDGIRDLEEEHGEIIKSKEYLTHRRGQGLPQVS